MRVVLSVCVLFVAFSCACATEDAGLRHRADGPKDDRQHTDIKQGDVKKRQVNRDRTYDSGEIYNPCDFEDDMDCVRHYFLSTGQCHEAHNYARQPLYRDQLLANIPGINLTIFYTKSRIQFTGDKISRFYINKTSANLVMAVDFADVAIDHRLAYFTYQRRGQEPIVLADFTNGNFSITLTAVIPIRKGVLEIKAAQVTPFIDTFSFVIGPKILNSTDPLVMQVNTALFANVRTSILEYYAAEAPSQFIGYVQKYICDFGLPITNVMYHKN